jgi:hypothetical protein
MTTRLKFLLLIVLIFCISSYLQAQNINYLPYPFTLDGGGNLVINGPITVTGAATFTETITVTEVVNASAVPYITNASIPENASFSFGLLNDVATRTGQADKVWKVKSDESGYEWGSLSGVSLGRQTITTAVSTTTVTFTLAFSNENSVILFANGVCLYPDVDYDLSSSYTVELASSVPSGSKIHAIKLN